MRIGIDLGGTKTEVIALGDAGEQLYRHRLPTPRDDYRQTIETIATLVDMAEQATGQRGTVGMGIPGSISPYTGVVKNANSTWLNGQPFDKDLSARLQVSGDTIRYRGWTKTNCVIARKSLVIAVNKVVLKPLFRARDSRWIIVV